MGVINLAIKLKRLFAKVNKIGKDVDTLSPQNYTFEWNDSTDIATYNEILSRCIADLPVRVFFSDNNQRKYIFDGTYYYYDEGIPLMMYGFSGKDRFGLTFTVDGDDVEITLTSFT